MDIKAKEVCTYLDKLNISYQIWEHAPAYTVEDMATLDASLPGQHCKNLFLQRRKKEEYYLLVADALKKVDLKSIAKALQMTGGFHFASAEKMEAYLGLTPGAVTPFGIINDTENRVHILLDDQMDQTGLIYFHPNVNTMTLGLSYSDFWKFLSQSGHKITYITAS